MKAISHISTTAVILCICGWMAHPAIAAEGSCPEMRRFEHNGKFGFKDKAGNVIVGPIYDDTGDFACGRCAVNQGAGLDANLPGAQKHGGKWGYINARGELVVPLALDWAYAFSEGLAQVSDQRGRRFIDTDGKTVIELGSVSSAGDFSEGLAPIHIDESARKKGWRTRFVNKKGETVFEVAGYAGGFREGLAVLSVRKDAESETKQCGYIDRSGKVVIAPKFAEAFDFHEGLAGVRTTKTVGWHYKGDTWGYIDRTGRWVLEPNYNETHPFCNGVARVHVGGRLRQHAVHAPPVWEGGEWQLIDRKGTVLKRSKEWLEYEDAKGKPNARNR